MPLTCRKFHIVRLVSRNLTLPISDRNNTEPDNTISLQGQVITIGPSFKGLIDNASFPSNGLSMRINFTAITDVEQKSKVQSFVGQGVIDTRHPIWVVVSQFYF